MTTNDTVPNVAVPNISGQADYETDLPPEALSIFKGEEDGLSDGEKFMLRIFMKAGNAITGGGFSDMMVLYALGIQFVWNNIIPDDLKAHGKRDYLYHNVADALLVGDQMYQKAKAEMLAAGTPEWGAFPSTGFMGASEIVVFTYWSLLVTWNSVFSKLRLPLDQLRLTEPMPYDLTFDKIWYDALKAHSFFKPVMWSERIEPDESAERGFGLGRDDENFKLSWYWHTDDPDQGEIEYFAARLAEFINGYRISALRSAVKDIVCFMARIKKADEEIYADLLRPTKFDEKFWQKNWRLCKQCGGLFYAGRDEGGCPKTGKGHDKSDSANYALHKNDPEAPEQHNWRWCKKCQGLFYAGRDENACPASGAHDGSGSADYIMHKKIEGQMIMVQSDWRWCKKCQGLYHLNGKDNGHCPAGGAHDGSTSGHYVLRMFDVSEEEKAKVH